MKIFSTVALMLLGASLALFAARAHQHHYGHHIHHHGALPPYNASTEETVEGTIEELFRWDRPGCSDCDGGAHVFLGGHDLEIHLGPFSYLESKGCQIGEGDAVRITGSKLSLSNGAVLVARELHCGDHHVVLRDESGRPLWRNQR